MQSKSIIGIKRYLRSTGGSCPEFWEDAWRGVPSTLDELAAQADARLVRECIRHLPCNAKILEGGCGCGTYLARFHQLGFDVVGIDFAKRTMERLKSGLTFLAVIVGDIRTLPFSDDTFDAYYSGGVIEHFEEGLRLQIEEAFRVLKPGGLFLVSVPYFNLVRRLSAYLFGDRFKVDLDGRKTYLSVISALPSDNESRRIAENGYIFHEYVLSTQYVCKMLACGGFSIEAIMPFSSRWGLLDVSWFRKLAGIGKVKRHLGHKLAAVPLRIIDIIEASSWTPAVYLADIVGLFFGNLQLYVARKSQQARE